MRGAFSVGELSALGKPLSHAHARGGRHVPDTLFSPPGAETLAKKGTKSRLMSEGSLARGADPQCVSNSPGPIRSHLASARYRSSFSVRGRAERSLSIDLVGCLSAMRSTRDPFERIAFRLNPPGSNFDPGRDAKSKKAAQPLHYPLSLIHI